MHRSAGESSMHSFYKDKDLMLHVKHMVMTEGSRCGCVRGKGLYECVCLASSKDKRRSKSTYVSCFMKIC